MTPRTVTVQTADYGAITVPEPAWCTGEHPDGLLRCEIAHTGPSIALTVGTRRGPQRLAELLLWQDPFPTPSNTNGADVYVTVHLLDADHFDYDVVGLEGLAADLLEAAGKVRYMARRLACETPRGER